MRKSKIYVVGAIRLLVIIIFLLIWEWSSKMSFYNPVFTSYPSEIFKDLVRFYTSGDLFKHGSITMYEAFLGLVFGSIAGVLVGIGLGQLKIVGKIFLPIITAINGIPQLTLAPVYILWFGLGISSKVFLSALMVFFHVFFSTYAGIQNVDIKLVEAANLLGAGKLKSLTHVVLPSSMPFILSGIRVGMGSSLVGAIIGEYIGSSSGFGWMISYSSSYFNIARVMSCISILLFVGVFLNFLLDRVEYHLLIWRGGTTDNFNISKE